MIIQRRLFSNDNKSELTDKEKNEIENKGIASGILLTGAGGTSYALANKAEKIGCKVIDHKTGKIIKQVNPKDVRTLKNASKVIIPVGLGLVSASAAAKAYRKHKNKKNENKS